MGPAGSRTLTDLVAESLGVEAADILDSDLQLVTRQAPTQIRPRRLNFSLAPRIDDLECAATTLLAFWMRRGDRQRLRPGLGDVRQRGGRFLEPDGCREQLPARRAGPHP